MYQFPQLAVFNSPLTRFGERTHEEISLELLQSLMQPDPSLKVHLLGLRHPSAYALPDIGRESAHSRGCGCSKFGQLRHEGI
jgi:hypothetical protein